MASDEKTFFVEKIVGYKKEDGYEKLLVCWKDFPNEEDYTWQWYNKLKNDLRDKDETKPKDVRNKIFNDMLAKYQNEKAEKKKKEKDQKKAEKEKIEADWIDMDGEEWTKNLSETERDKHFAKCDTSWANVTKPKSTKFLQKATSMKSIEKK
jgi:hypothetical protein